MFIICNLVTYDVIIEILFFNKNETLQKGLNEASLKILDLLYGTKMCSAASTTAPYLSLS